MEFIHHRLQETDEGYVVYLYISPNLEEFSNEFGTKPVEEERKMKQLVNKYVKKRLTGLHIVTAKVVIGTSIIMTIPLNTMQVSAHDASFNMTYSFFGSTASVIQSVDRTKGALNVISPSYFNVNADGSLALSGVDTTFIKEMHSRNIKVVPFLSNHWNRSVGEAAVANREKLASQIAEAIEKYELDGVNVDIENVNEKSKDGYTDLVRLLREKIPAHKEVSVAIAANPNHWKTGWHGSYDNKELAKHADYLMLMAYDESYQGGPAGPVASVGWVDRSIKALVIDENIDPNKIVLGLPFFGRYWNSHELTGGYGASNHQIESLIKKYNGSITYDSYAESPRANFTIKAADPTSIIGGRTLKPGNYEVWYENDQSLKAKIDLVHKYNLKGTGSWSIGQENPSVWNNYGIWLASHDGEENVPVNLPVYPHNNFQAPFEDVKNHWARDEIFFVKEKEWFHGKNSTTFGPNDELSRAEAAAVLVRMLDLKPLKPIGNSFSDVPKSFWGHEDIEIAKQHGIFHGRGDGSFGPDQELTREQMAKVFDNIFKEQYDPSKVDIPVNFKDVSRERWSWEVIVAMKQQGIFEGTSSATFAPTESVTRAQMAVVLTRSADFIAKRKNESLYPRIIKQGSVGVDVILLQIQLKKLGFYHNDLYVNGFFDEETINAVRSFQTSHDLTVDGIVGGKTSQRILAEQ
ncbi:Spore germination protein YaaH [Gracilibacillus ureilyticus]|uniref:Spore germination protein YaaH n=1 Tax=Gracilibacillus ureilyticus TaxID=531814 RepID=A0A1H9P9T7_9BACI|nr:glycosyl hydrolase family 18 protein [Gracilibacillus ureilyticus]SER44871.1 Spore germination protein YaaH [Gracilibacillus ureilyticus]